MCPSVRGIFVRLFQKIAGLQIYLSQERPQKRVGFVPTMGALHQGHGSLIEQARRENELVVVSIFVNPLQFGPTEDLAKYPRLLEQDCQICEDLGVDVVFAPSAKALGIDSGDQTQTMVIPPESLTRNLCATFRPGHFPGVATIVS